MIYSNEVMDHFMQPRNVGEIPDADGVGMIGDPECGDHLTVWIKVADNVIVDAKFKCKGCPAAIAAASMMTEMAIGKDLDEAMEITDEQIADALGGMPEQKRHCSVLGADALSDAITDHVLRSIGVVPARSTSPSPNM